MCTEFIDALRKCIIDKGYLIKRNEQEQLDGEIMVAYAGRLFVIQSDFHLNESRDDYMATGSGYEVALGSLRSTRKEPDATKRILAALEAAAHHITTVGGPFKIISTQE